MDGTMPYSIGLETLEDGKECCSNFISKGTVLPTGVKRTFYPNADGQKSMSFDFYKNGEDKDLVPLESCEKLGHVDIPLPADATAKTPVECVFTAGLNGLLIITASCKGMRSEKYLDL